MIDYCKKVKIKDYSLFTEVSGTKISEAQLYRMRHRYSWAQDNIEKKSKVLELCCGSGQGISILIEKSNVVDILDVTENLLKNAIINNPKIRNSFYKDAITFLKENEEIYDFIVIFEALYYFDDLKELITLAKKSLSKNGKIFLTWPNPLSTGFQKCKHTYLYPTFKDFIELFGSKMQNKFEIFGLNYPKRNNFRTKLKAKIKEFALKLNLMPKTQKGKTFLKSIFEGKLINMPNNLNYLSNSSNDLFKLENDDDITNLDPIVLYAIIKK